MPAGNDLSFVGNLLALPLTLQAMHQQWEQQRQSQAGQLQTAASAPQMSSPFAPQSRPLGPEPPNPTGALNTPVLGTALRGIGTVGQILQVIGAPPPAAPRPMTAGEQIGVQKWQQQQTTGRRMSEAYGRGASREELAQIEAEGGFPAASARLYSQASAGSTGPFGAFYQQGLEIAKEKNYVGSEATSFARAWAIDQTQAQKREGQKPEAPTFDRDLEAEATRRGLTGQAKFEWKEQERGKAAGIKTTATSAAAAATKDDANVQKELLANRQVKAQLRDARDRVAKLLTKNPLGLATQPLALALERMGGNADAIAAKQLVLFAPQLAKAHGLTARFNQTEFQMYADALDGSKMTAQQYVAALDNMLHSLDLSEQEMKNLKKKDSAPGGPSNATPDASQQWHDTLDSLGVPK